MKPASAAPAAPAPPAVPLATKAAAFLALVAIQVTLALVYKAAQDPAGNYAFDPAAILCVAELVKLLLSLAFFARERLAMAPAARDRERDAHAIARQFTHRHPRERSKRQERQEARRDAEEREQVEAIGHPKEQRHLADQRVECRL